MIPPPARTDAIQQQRIQQAVSQMLAAIGEDPQREGLRETPERVARMYAELFSGVGQDPAAAIDALFDEDFRDPVVLRDITFHSMCEHHLLPFFGKAHLAYLPNGKIAGISKFARALEVAARRPQVQERLTAQLADAIFTALRPSGLVVLLEAEHMCIAMRGIEKPGTRIVTAATRGDFSASAFNAECLLALLQRK